ncbi:MAG: ribosome rescue protein RqcH [Thermoplasmata archaeon]
MKDEMESLEISAVCREFESLVGGYVQKVYQPGKDTLSFRIHVPELGKKMLFFKLGKALYLSEREIDNPMHPGGYVMLLRKHLGNARIENIRQHEFDRVVVMELRAQRNFQMVFEVFGKGNLVLVTEDDILLPYRSESWKHRDLKKGEVYKFPPSRVHPFELESEEIKKKVLNSNTDLVRTLAVGLNLGGKYAEELCLRMGVDKNTSELEPLVDEIMTALDQLKRSLSERKLEPCVVLDGDEKVDAVPFALNMYSEYELKKKETYSGALDEVFKPLIEESQERKVKSKIERRLEMQKKAMPSLESGITENRIKAELIYQNYNLCDELLKTILEAREEGIREEVFQALASSEKIKQINDSDEYVVVELEGKYDGKKHESDVRLDFRKDVNANAQMYYQKSKKCRKKLEGAKRAIEETKKQIKSGLKEDKKTIKESTPQFWFDRFKWFISSQGNLVVAGKDAQSNEEVVKKYLEKNGRYAHAEAGGAPSVVVRKGEGKIKEDTLGEACQFALVHSKEWKRGIASGTAYWVEPSQVSKTPEAGESLPTGAFVIRGKRNYVSNIPMEAVLTEVDFKGKKKIMCAPSWAVKGVPKKQVSFTPGTTPVGDFAREMSDHFKVPQEEIQKVLPPGDVKIIKKGV